MRIFTAAGLLALVLGASPTFADVLYAPTNSPKELLNAAPWNWNYTTLGGVTLAPGASGTVLNSIPFTNTAQAGFNISNGGSYNNALMPVISATTGYTIRFQVAVTAEQHNDRNTVGNPNDDDRAGFSIIAVSSDNSKAIELGFFTDLIFAQNSNFVGRAEQAAFNTTSLTTYDLTVQGNGYTLASGGNTLLTGSLHAYNLNGNVINDAIYSQTNWIFLGDDTTSAAANAQIAYVEILPVPEPASLTLAALGGIALLRRRRK